MSEIEVTEQDIREDAIRHGGDPDSEFHQAFVDLWKTGKIYVCGRNNEGRLLWNKTPEA